MRGNLVIGMVAGGVIGIAAAMIAAPYVQPQIRRVVSRGKQAFTSHIDKMDTES